MQTISIIIPAYNSETRIPKLIQQVQDVQLPNLKKEIIVVDDYSTDNTYNALQKIKGITLLHHNKNTGKGGAVRTGLAAATGTILFLQDDDLEYNPQDIPVIIQPILDKKAEIVFGSRRLNNKNAYSSSLYYIGGVFVDQIISFILQSNTTDAITGSKAFTRNVYNTLLPIKSNGFEIEAEIAAKAVKKGFKPIEVPISYNPRTVAEGKNIRWHHAYPIIMTLLRYAWFS